MAFILASQNLPFAIALALMLLIAVLEGVTTLIGAGISSLLESMLPDIDLDVDLDLDGTDVKTGSTLTKILGWLRVGQVPVLVILIIFLTAFGLIGLGIQSLAVDIAGMLLPSLAAVGIAFFLCLPVVRLCAGVVAKVMPKDETEAVSETSFIGLVAVITLGTARAGKAAQGKLKDRYGQSHYVMIEPDKDDDVFEQGASVLLVRQQGAIFKAIPNPSAALETT